MERARQQHYFYGASYLAALMCSLRNKALSKQEWYFFSNTQLHVTQQAIRQIPYPADQTESALRVLHYLSGLIRFCLQHYQQLHQRMGHLPIQNRTLMVVDMQNRLNQWKLMRQILQPFR